MTGKRPTLLCGAAVGMVALVGCDDTNLVRSWTAPDADSAEVNKIVTFVMTKSQSTRRVAEEAMAEQLRERGLEAVPGYKVIPETDLQDVDSAKQRIAAAGFDGAYILRPLGEETEINYAGGAFPPYYSTFWGYYGWGWPYVYDPAYVYTTTVHRLEGMLYSVNQNRLLWSGLLENQDGHSLSDMAQEVTKEVAESLSEKEILASLR